MKAKSLFKDGKKRPTIGFIIDWVGGRYQSQVWLGAVAAATERDANLIIFSGRSLRAPQGYLSQSNSLYDVISNENLDGLVILSGTISNYMPPDEFSLFFNHFHPLPMVSISIEMEGVPSVLIDNRAGIRAIMSHFIEIHGYRRIAFICGPEVNDEASQRFAVYQEELAHHNIPFDPMLVAPGDFSEDAGIRAVDILLDERRVNPDVIVAVDDDTALGVLKALQARGLSVPDDIALSGFDDINEARFSSPPLTTVLQPFYAQSHLAVSILLDQLEGKPVQQKTLLPMEIVVRQSCGCMAETVRLAGTSAGQTEDGLKNKTPIEFVIGEVQKAIERNCFRQSGRKNASEFATMLVNSFVLDLNNRDTNNFIKTLGQILQAAVVHHDDIGKWQNVISAMRNVLMIQWREQAENRRAEELWGQARVFIGEAMERLQAYQLLQFRNHSLVESEVNRSVLATLEFEELKSIMAELLPTLGVISSYIVLSKAERYNPSSLLLAFNETGVLTDEIPVVYNPLMNIIPEQFLPRSRRYTLVMEALYFQSETLGFALFEMNPQQDGILYSELRQQISSALKGALLLLQYKENVQETQSINKELTNYRENLERMVIERTEELSIANKQLQQEIFERKQSELERENLIRELTDKNAELERFTYTVSHELKSPIVTMKGFVGSIGHDLKNQKHERAEKDLLRVATAVDKMHDTLSDLLELSRVGRMMNESADVPFADIVQDALKLVHGQLEKRQATVQTQPNLPAVHGDRQRLIEVLHNLIDNAAKYMGNQTDPLIEIGQRGEDEGKLIFFIRDNGMGIANEYHERIFGLFNKLDAISEGTGIGLALVKRIVEFHGGRIWVESEPGKGSTFLFTLPPAGTMPVSPEP